MREFERRQLVAAAQADPAAHDAGSDVAEVVVDDGGAGARSEQERGEGVGLPGAGDPAAEHERDTRT
ncbi:hypothetical protein GCM10027360_66070 [Amycolatopsis echigonensis]